MTWVAIAESATIVFLCLSAAFIVRAAYFQGKTDAYNDVIEGRRNMERREAQERSDTPA